MIPEICSWKSNPPILEVSVLVQFWLELLYEWERGEVWRISIKVKIFEKHLPLALDFSNLGLIS